MKLQTMALLCCGVLAGPLNCSSALDAPLTTSGKTSTGGTTTGGATGGSGAPGSGGTTGSGGTGGIGGSGGSGGAGGLGGGNGGSDGSGGAGGVGGGNGGVGGAGGISTPAGSGGSRPVAGTTGSTTGLGTLCPLPQALITDFTYTPIDGGTGARDPHFGDAGGLQGGGGYYPTTGITSDVTQGNWHLTGTIADYAGFFLYFDNCSRVDASSFQGISFTISGSVQGNAITLGMGTVADTPSGTWLQNVGGSVTATAKDPGRCIPTSGNQYYHPGCTDPAVQIPVTATPTVITVRWTDFTGGAPEATVTPSEVTSIYWFFPWYAGGTPYALDLVIDDLRFVP